MARPHGNTVRKPLSLGSTTVKVATTEVAAAGTPACPAIGKATTRPPTSRDEPPWPTRVSTTRVGVTGARPPAAPTALAAGTPGAPAGTRRFTGTARCTSP